MSRITRTLVTFQNVANQGFSKNSQVREGGGSQNLGTVPKLYLVIKYDGFPKSFNTMSSTSFLNISLTICLYLFWTLDN